MRKAPARVRAHRALLAVLAVALLLRGGMVALNEITPAYDAADYQRIAVVLSETGGYPPTTYAAPGTPSAFRPPAWPYALAATKVVAGEGETAGRLLGALLGTLSVLLVFLVARDVWNRRTALTAAWLTAVFPPLLFADTSLLSEVLFTPCMLGMVWALLRAQGNADAWRWLPAAGALNGLAMLTRSSGVVLLAPLAIGAWRAAGGTRGRTVAAVALAVAAAAVVVAPWTIRNAVVFGELVPVSTQGGYSLAATYNPSANSRDEFRGAARMPADVPALGPLLGRPGHDEADLGDELGRLGREYAADNPGYVLDVMRLNTIRMLLLGGVEQKWRTRLAHAEMGVPERADGLLALSVLAALLAAIAGVVALVRRSPGIDGRRGPLWLWAIPLLLWLVTVVISGGPRYRVVLDPFLLMLAAVALTAWRTRRHRRRHRIA